MLPQQAQAQQGVYDVTNTQPHVQPFSIRQAEGPLSEGCTVTKYNEAAELHRDRRGTLARFGEAWCADAQGRIDRFAVSGQPLYVEVPANHKTRLDADDARFVQTIRDGSSTIGVYEIAGFDGVGKTVSGWSQRNSGGSIRFNIPVVNSDRLASGSRADVDAFMRTFDTIRLLGDEIESSTDRDVTVDTIETAPSIARYSTSLGISGSRANGSVKTNPDFISGDIDRELYGAFGDITAHSPRIFLRAGGAFAGGTETQHLYTAQGTSVSLPPEAKAQINEARIHLDGAAAIMDGWGIAATARFQKEQSRNAQPEGSTWEARSEGGALGGGIAYLSDNSHARAMLTKRTFDFTGVQRYDDWGFSLQFDRLAERHTTMFSIDQPDAVTTALSLDYDRQLRPRDAAFQVGVRLGGSVRLRSYENEQAGRVFTEKYTRPALRFGVHAQF